VTFRGHAGFTGTFQGPVDFSRSAFRNGVFLRGEFNDGVDFSDVDVTSEVILSLVNTTLSKVDFTGTTFPPRTEMNFPGSDFTDFDLSAVEEYLIHPDFKEADLTGVDFSDWNLTGATFTHANLTDATLKNANVSGADFTNAVLVGSDIQQARNVDEAVFSQAIFRTMNLRTRRFTACTLSADVPGDTTQHFEMSSRKAARSSEEYRRTDFSQADFSDADLHNAEFTCANLADAIFDDAICRFTDFRNANLEGASFINTDLRSARFDGARIYGATFTNCEMNPDTTITHVDLYDAPPPPRGVLSSQIRAMRRRLSRFLPTRPSDDAVEEDEDTPPTCVEEFGAKSETADADESHSEDEDGGGAEDGRIEPTQSDVEQLRKKAWTHGAIHRQLITAGRHRKALTEKHYLKEQNAKMRRARLKGQLVRRSELWFMKRFLKASEVPAYLLFVIVLFAVGAIVPYLLAGGIRDTATGVHYTPTTLTLEGMGRVFLYSFVTLLDGVYLVIKTPLEDFLPFEVFDQLGSIAVQLLGLSQLEPVGAAAYVHVVVQAMGAVLIVPFSLLVVNHIRTIFGSTTSEEGVDSGFVAWFFGR
jgi:uncharacterized protein YjbI with pentapeptide repeats